MNVIVAAILLFTMALAIIVIGAVVLFLCIWGGSWIFYWNREWLRAVVEWVDRTFKFPPI